MLIKKVVIDKANRLYQLPPDIRSFVPSEPKRSLVKRTESLDLATFTWPVGGESGKVPGQTGLQAASQKRLINLKEELAGWFRTYHGVKIEPSKEIFIGGPISSLMFTISLAFINNGDIAFVPELGIPLYRRVTTACGGETVSYSVSSKNNWLPDFERVHTRLGRVAGILFLNSPHNPTGAELREKELADLVWLASRENIIIVNDAAYAAISNRKQVSLMSINGGKRVGVEVYSFAYNFGLSVAPFGFVVGNREVIHGLKLASRVVSNFIPEYYINMALSAIRQFPNDLLKETRATIACNLAEGTRLLSMLGLEKVGFDTVPFIWAKIERRRQAATAAALLYRRNRILVVPGTAFGDSGEGFLRFSLTALPALYSSAVERLMRRRKHAKLGGDK